jgi:ABC-2 type transport system permease protein
MKTPPAAMRSSTSTTSRPRLGALGALIRRDYVIARSYRLAFFLDLVFGVLNLIIFYFISKTFGSQPTTKLDGAPTYFAFAALGISVMVVMEAASIGLANRLREEQLTGTLEALVTQPVAAVELALGLTGYPFLFAMSRAAFYVLVSAAFLGVDVRQTSWLGFVLMLSVTGAALAAIGIFLGAVVLVVKRSRVIASIVTFGLGLFGGAFFPLSVLPSWLRPFGKIAPTRFAFDGLRAAVFRGSGWGHDLFALALFSAVALPVAVWLFSAALRAVRRSGSLLQY